MGDAVTWIDGSSIRVRVRHRDVTYELVDGDTIEILHYDEPILVEGPVTREWHVDDPGPEPKQPPGWVPRHGRVRG